MKQLIKIKARFLKENDLIFDFKTRKVQKIEYVELDNFNSVRECENVFISYGLESDVSDNFKPYSDVLILIDTDNIEVLEPKYIRG